MVSLFTSFYCFRDFSEEFSRELEMELFIMSIVSVSFFTFIVSYRLDDENKIKKQKHGT